MKRSEFAMLCEEYFIDPAIALENETVKILLQDIKNSDDEYSKSDSRNALVHVLETEF